MKQTTNDPSVEQFLAFLDTDIHEHPQHVQQISSNLVYRIQSSVGNIDINLNEKLVSEEE